MPPLLTEEVNLSHLFNELRRREATIIDRIRTLVEIESPSGNKAAVDHAQTVFQEWAVAVGGKVKRHRHREYGDSLEIRFGTRKRQKPSIMLLGHMDTVWEMGTLALMPFKVSKERIAGPGVLDMKAGDVMALTSVELLLEMELLRRQVTLLIHGDEEVGSPASRGVTETVAAHHDAVYVLEPGQGDAGAYKTARKAVGMYRLHVQGVAAHSGVDFTSGHSAVVELARQIEVLHELTDLERGITVNPGVIGGGTGSNVIAAEAWALIDVRIPRKQYMAGIDRAIRRLKPFDKRCKLTLSGGMNRPPMERTRGTAALFRRAKLLGSQLGIQLDEAATGGASDGNFTSALGVATLDGMGAVGAGAHAPHEHLMREHLVPRTALLAAMLT